MEFLFDTATLKAPFVNATFLYFKDDETTLGIISFWALLLLFSCFCAYAGYATYHVLIKKKEAKTQLKMFYYSADATLLRKSPYFFLSP